MIAAKIATLQGAAATAEQQGRAADVAQIKSQIDQLRWQAAIIDTKIQRIIQEVDALRTKEIAERDAMERAEKQADRARATAKTVERRALADKAVSQIAKARVRVGKVPAPASSSSSSTSVRAVPAAALLRP